MIIAIDGPAGSGKSTIARAVAERLGFAYLDTGAMYRAITWQALKTGCALSNDAALAQLAATTPIRFGYAAGEALPSQVYCAGEEVTTAIRSAEVNAAVSQVSAVPAVRAALVAQQQAIGAERDTVMEGRDIGTVVFPEAELKVFLTARPEVRAARRSAQNSELAASGAPSAASAPLGTAASASLGAAASAPPSAAVSGTSPRPATDAALPNGAPAPDTSAPDASAPDTSAPDTVLAELLKRDKLDSERETSPLVAASDARVLDTSDLTIEQVVNVLAGWAQA